MIVDIARDYFSFVEDKHVKVVIYTFMSFSWGVVGFKSKLGLTKIKPDC